MGKEMRSNEGLILLTNIQFGETSLRGQGAVFGVLVKHLIIRYWRIHNQCCLHVMTTFFILTICA